MGLFKKKKGQSPAPNTKQGNNPYLNAREEWLERCGSYMTRAANWRAVAFVALFTTLLSLCGNIIQAAAIAMSINDWRTVTADVELQKQMISRASYFFTGAAKGILKEWYSHNSPYEIAKSGKLVHVEIKSLPLPISSDTYRIEWIETVRTHTGVTVSTTPYEASVTVMIVPPASEEVLLRNPGGVQITDISANRIFS